MKKLIFLLILVLTGCTLLNSEEKTEIEVLEPVEEVVVEETPVVQEPIKPVVKEEKPKVEEIEIINKTVEEEIINETIEEVNLTEEIKEPEVIVKEYDSIINLGDSLSYGFGLENPEESNWGKLLSNELNAIHYNYAVNSATSFSVNFYQLDLLKNEVIEGNKLAFIWIGANDAVNFISLPEFEANLRNTIDYIINLNNTDLVLINIPDASKLSVADTVQSEAENLLAEYGITTNIEVKTLTKDVLQTYNNVIDKIGTNYNLTVIDMFNYLENLDDSLITEDRFHPNEKGHEMIAGKVIEDLEII